MGSTRSRIGRGTAVALSIDSTPGSTKEKSSRGEGSEEIFTPLVPMKIKQLPTVKRRKVF